MAADDKSLTENLDPLPPTKDAVAVALAHEREEDSAPKVVAGGRGRVAEQILELAFQNGVKVRQDPDLAQLLSAIDVESEIPLEAFAAVAEILVYVYQANNNPLDGSPDATVSELAKEMAEKWSQSSEPGS